MFDVISRLESVQLLDRPAAGLHAVADVVVRGPRLRALLEGVPFGHSMHPMLVQVPVGAWVSAGWLDCAPRTENAAALLTAIGIASAVPAAAAGLADFRHLTPADRRVAVVHATANIASLSLQVASLRARLTGRLRRGQWIGLAGTATLAVGGLLGAHLAHRLSDSAAG